MLTTKSLRVTLLDLYLGVICVFPIATTLIESGAVNKIMFGVLLVLHICMLMSRPVRRQTIVMCSILVVNYVFTLCYTVFPMENINLFIYFPFYILYTYFMCDNSDIIINWFSKHRGYVKLIVFVWSVLVGISIFVPSCYTTVENESVYFGSFCGSIFRLGPSAVFIQVLAIVMQVMHGKKSALLVHLVPMYCYLMGSSRTYLVVGSCLLVIAWYFACKKKIMFWGTVVPLMLGVLGLVTVSAMGDKIAYTLDENQYGDFWFRVTSSRSVLWEQDLTGFAESPLLNKLLGNGLGFTTEVSGLWAHNDFIEVICSFGIIGLVHYLYSTGHLFKRGYRRVKISFVVRVCAFMAWFFNAFFNMHYVYFCAMLCYPVLLFAIRIYFEKNPVKRKHKRSNEDRSILKEWYLSKI